MDREENGFVGSLGMNGGGGVRPFFVIAKRGVGEYIDFHKYL